jgi:hypothetical protein
MTGNATAAPLLRRAMQADAAISGASRRPDVNIWAGRAVIFLNLLWVAASAVLLLAEPGLFNGPGQWLVGLVALAVADLALVQYIGLRRASRTLAAATA